MDSWSLLCEYLICNIVSNLQVGPVFWRVRKGVPEFRIRWEQVIG